MAHNRLTCPTFGRLCRSAPRDTIRHSVVKRQRISSGRDKAVGLRARIEVECTFATAGVKSLVGQLCSTLLSWGTCGSRLTVSVRTCTVRVRIVEQMLIFPNDRNLAPQLQPLWFFPIVVPVAQRSRVSGSLSASHV
jgi:hypothetical protein